MQESGTYSQLKELFEEHFSNKSSTFNKDEFITLLIGETAALKKLSEVIQKNKIESIIHLAAYLNISESETNKKKYYKNNVIGTLNLVKACKNSHVKTIIFSSSCSVYGSVKG